MEISANRVGFTDTRNTLGIKNLYTEKLSKDDVKELKQQVVDNANAFTFNSASLQTEVLSLDAKFQKDYEDFQNFLKDVGYKGKPIAELSQEEAKAIVSEDGFFGIKQTSERIANFVVSGANGDESLLRAGREGVLQGFNDAQEAWGSELPEISKKTIDAAIALIDKTMMDLGYSILDKEA